MNRFLEWLHRIGRKNLVIRSDGQILMERYFPFRHSDRGIHNNWRMKLPNILLHHFPANVEDDFIHDHGRACASIVLRGGYTEVKNGKTYVRRAGHIFGCWYDTMHHVYDILPGTWTIFFVGYWRAPYRIKRSVEGPIMTRADLSQTDTLTGSKQDTPELRARIARRRKAMSKLNERKVA